MFLHFINEYLIEQGHITTYSESQLCINIYYHRSWGSNVYFHASIYYHPKDNIYHLYKDNNTHIIDLEDPNALPQIQNFLCSKSSTNTSKTTDI